MFSKPKITFYAMTVLAMLLCGCTGPSTGPPDTGSSSQAVTSTSWNLPADDIQYGPARATSPFCGYHLPTATKPFGLLVPSHLQKTSDWCVLAAVQMVAGYYGLTVDQCRLADWRDEYPEGTCCAAPFDPRCNHGTGVKATIKLLSGLGLYGAYAPEPLPEDQLREEVSNGRPVIFIEAASTHSHAIVAFGYKPSTDGPDLFTVYDPVVGYRELSYDDMRADYWNGWSVWPATFYRIAPSPDGCNTGFDTTCACGDG